jgi:hypothetical protein
MFWAVLSFIHSHVTSFIYKKSLEGWKFFITQHMLSIFTTIPNITSNELKAMLSYCNSICTTTDYPINPTLCTTAVTSPQPTSQ